MALAILEKSQLPKKTGKVSFLNGNNKRTLASAGDYAYLNAHHQYLTGRH
jgi:hypothetical protein